ncbi:MULTISPECIES: GFA family protein [Sphingomonas]|uniref:GFA family protein n=1 Tax=Sphingomonas TaxID=13687 RepID=UPI001F496684|nr:GFA family protein [Sphingomonas sp. ABOLF]
MRATCTGEPVRVSVCHCLECQKRSGSAFAVQARWPDAQVALAGEFRTWTQQGDSGAVARFRFCPTCGATLVYASEGMPGLTAVAVGAFADPGFPAPHYSVWEDRKHGWVTVSADGMEHFA